MKLTPLNKIQIETLKKLTENIHRIDPASDVFKNLTAYIDKQSQETLIMLARNRINIRAI